MLVVVVVVVEAEKEEEQALQLVCSRCAEAEAEAEAREASRETFRCRGRKAGGPATREREREIEQSAHSFLHVCHPASLTDEKTKTHFTCVQTWAKPGHAISQALNSTDLYRTHPRRTEHTPQHC